MNFIFINSHPIQYFAPLYSYLNGQGVNTSVWYCSNENVSGHRDRQFNANVTWDIPLLKGYSHRFFKNYSLRPSIYGGFFGLFNPGLIHALFREPRSVVIVHGWGYVTHVLALVVGRLAGHVVCLRAETPWNQEILKSRLNQWLKRLVLAKFLFRFVNKFLYIGSQNRQFYQRMGVVERKLVFVPYAVDNKRFQEAAAQFLPQKKLLRKELGLPENGRIFLYAAKYIHKKRPMDLLAAFEKLQVKDKCLVMVGEGDLRGQMESIIRSRKLVNVHLTGFKNQTEIERYYAMADVFVMCSGPGETWGLSVNEAMNFNLPVVVSSISGCATDLVVDGENGFTFRAGDTDELESKMMKALHLDGSAGRTITAKYSFSTITQSLKQLQESVVSEALNKTA